MRNDDVKLRCHKCGNEYSTREMRQSPFGPNLVCRNCLEGKRPVKAQAARAESPSSVAFKSKPETGLLDYTCANCKFNFKRKKGIEIERCPNCNQQGTVALNKGTAQTLVEESGKRQYDY